MSSIHGEPIVYSDPALHGMRFLPAQAPVAAAVLIAPLFEERRCAHRALVTCARALAGAGVAVLLPDLTATGNSPGDLRHVRLTQWRDDLAAAVASLQTHVAGRLCLIGCRAGALLALDALAGGLAVDRLLLWQPVLAGKSYLTQARTRRMIQDSLTGQDAPTVSPQEVEGQDLSPELHAELAALAFPDAPPTVDTRLLQCSFSAKPLAEYQRVVTRWGAERLSLHCLIQEPFWHPHSPGSYAELAEALVEEVLA